MRFGIDVKLEHAYPSNHKIFKISHEHVRQIEHQALQKLRDNLICMNLDISVEE